MARKCHRRVVREFLLAFLFCLLLAGPVSALVPKVSEIGVPKEATAEAVLPLVWLDNIETAVNMAGAEYRPVLVMFSSPDCGWCRRMKAQIDADKHVKQLLGEYVLAEIDVSISPEVAATYALQGVPTLVFMSGDGRVRRILRQYVPVEQLIVELETGLNPAFVRERDGDYTALLSKLQDGSLDDACWRSLMGYVGQEGCRETIRSAVRGLHDFPGTNLVTLLGAQEFVVRMGALDLLEEFAGEDMDYDPWSPTSEPVNAAALDKWTQWARDTGATATNLYAALTSERIDAYVRDLLSPDRRRSVRAMQMLEDGGQQTAAALTKFLVDNPELNQGARKRLQEVKYAVLIGGGSDLDGTASAHRLVYGTLDARLKGIAELKASGVGVQAVPILRDFLYEDNALLREAACEAILDVAGGRGVAVVVPCLKREKDPNVLYAGLRALGGTKEPRAVLVLKEYLVNENEDLVVVAIQGLTKLQFKGMGADLPRCLKDPRWQVRVAALEAVEKLKLKSLIDDVSKLLQDEDDFVRRSAVTALGAVIDKTDSLKYFANIFRENDDLKGLIISRLGKAGLAIPESFVEEVRGGSKAVVLDVLTALDDCGERGLGLAATFAEDPDADVSCSALRIVAEYGAGSEMHRALLCRVLKEGQREQTLAVLDNVEIKAEDFAIYRAHFRRWFEGQGRASGADAPDAASSDVPSVVDDLFAAFDGAGDWQVPGVESNRQEEGVTADDLFAAFGGDSDPEAEAGNRADSDGVSLVALVDALEEVLENTADEQIRSRAAISLATLGNPKALPFLVTSLPEQTVDGRVQIGQAVGKIVTEEARDVNRLLLADRAEQVRDVAVNNYLRQWPVEGVDILFGEVSKTNSPLKVAELGNHLWSDALKRPNVRRNVRAWVPRLLDSARADMQSLGLLMASHVWMSAYTAQLQPFVESQNPFHRRAALYAIGMQDQKAFLAHVAAVAEDPSPKVRAVLPAVFSENTHEWQHYFSADVSTREMYVQRRAIVRFSGGSRSGSLPVECEEALRRITRDKDPALRVDAFFCLVKHRKSVDVREMARALDAVPDATAVADRVAALLVDSEVAAGPEFRALLPYAYRARNDGYYVEQLKRRYGDVDTAEELLALSVLSRKGPGAQPIMATYGESVERAASAENGTNTLSLIYFYQPGCHSCGKVEELLEDMHGYFEGLNVVSHNIRRYDAMRLNEVLCNRLQVEDRSRLIAPSVFTSVGCLIKDDIAFDRLSGLLARASQADDDDWYQVSEEDLSAADDVIAERHENMSLGVVLSAAVIDGVNPCAFATIIFFLSYLHVARRSRREILQVGLAFIVGVFATYFAMGAGLIQLMERIAFLESASSVVNVVLAVGVLILAALSARDGVLCLRGRMKDMVLQLPGALKQGIHGVIRHGARHRRFVFAAFVVGIAISVLELACTGQVYLPTIAYMVQRPGSGGHALGYLALYNVAFILPLVVVFGLAAAGMTHARLSGFLERHAALVKFAMAAILAALGVLFLQTFL